MASFSSTHSIVILPVRKPPALLRFKMSIDNIGNIDRTYSATLTVGVERFVELSGVAMGIERVENIVLHVDVWNDIILCRNMNLVLT